MEAAMWVMLARMVLITLPPRLGSSGLRWAVAPILPSPPPLRSLQCLHRLQSHQNQQEGLARRSGDSVVAMAGMVRLAVNLVAHAKLSTSITLSAFEGWDHIY